MKHPWMLVLCWALAAAPAAAQVTIGPGGGGSEFAWFANYPSRWHARGQTFTVPTEASALTSFSFWLSGSFEDAPPTPFRFYVAAWDQGAFRATGEVLFRSALYPGLGREVYAGARIIRYDFDTGLLDLTPGGVYLAFLGAPEDVPSGPTGGATAMRVIEHRPYDGDVYPEGTFVTGMGVYGPNALADASWSPNYIEGPVWDAQFEAQFTATPEPATMALLGTGLAGLAGAARRRRRREAAAD